MKRLILWIKYRQLLRRIEKAGIYDGRGKGVDIYECSKCGHKVYTWYKDKGVTPFTIGCPKCHDIMMHTKTVGTTPGIMPIPWLRPTFKQMLKLSPGMIEHVLQGSLILKTHLK